MPSISSTSRVPIHQTKKIGMQSSVMMARQRCSSTPTSSYFSAPNACAASESRAVMPPMQMLVPLTLAHIVARTTAPSCLAPRWPTNMMFTCCAPCCRQNVADIGQASLASTLLSLSLVGGGLLERRSVVRQSGCSGSPVEAEDQPRWSSESSSLCSSSSSAGCSALGLPPFGFSASSSPSMDCSRANCASCESSRARGLGKKTFARARCPSGPRAMGVSSPPFGPDCILPRSCVTFAAPSPSVGSAFVSLVSPLSRHYRGFGAVPGATNTGCCFTATVLVSPFQPALQRSQSRGLKLPAAPPR